MFSDKDIPKEKLHKQKLIYKKELFRVLKEVRQRGISYEKPAYYDRVTFKTITITEEEYHNGDLIEMLQSVNTTEQHILKEDRWIDKAMQSMKRQEISIYV